MRRWLADTLTPFRQAGRPNWPVVAIFVLINGLVLTNAILHDPRQGYDAADHLNYIKALATKHAIPSCAETGQCYVPPLPYLLPAILLSAGRLTLLQAARLAQLFDVILSCGLTYYLLRICELVKPGNAILKACTLTMLGIVPVYYKTFALIRGETYIAFLSVVACFLLLSIFDGKRANAANVLALGLIVGLSILSVQWGLLLVPAVLLLAGYAAVRDRENVKPALFAALACLLTPLVIGGWYYLFMYGRYGTLLAAGWDRKSASAAQAPLPMSFFVGLGSGRLFSDPVRPSFENQLPAIFYADTWGDYGAYFLVYGRDPSSGAYVSGQYLERLAAVRGGPPAGLDTNWQTFATYLGWVNFVSLIPSAVLLAGVIFGLGRIIRIPSGEPDAAEHLASVFAVLFIGCSLGGYLWYLIHYQINGQAGDLIKAVHMAQVFPFLALLAGSTLEGLHGKRQSAWTLLMLALGLVFLIDTPAMITRYVLRS